MNRRVLCLLSSFFFLLFSHLLQTHTHVRTHINVCDRFRPPPGEKDTAAWFLGSVDRKVVRKTAAWLLKRGRQVLQCLRACLLAVLLAVAVARGAGNGGGGDGRDSTVCFCWSSVAHTERERCLPACLPACCVVGVPSIPRMAHPSSVFVPRASLFLFSSKSHSIPCLPPLPRDGSLVPPNQSFSSLDCTCRS